MKAVIPQRPSYPLAIVLGCLLSFSAMAQELPGTAAFKGLDKNGDGKRDRSELPAGLFDRLDADKDGCVTEEELRALWKAR